MKFWQLKIAIAPDSFKGFLSAGQAAECMAQGLRKALPGARLILIPMADGGEGTADAIVRPAGGRFVFRWVRDPLGRLVRAKFGVIRRGKTAVLEMAAAAGLNLVKPKDRNPALASTAGVGELLRNALELGVEEIILGLGGSATNDAGCGMAAALGVKFLDAQGRVLPEGGVFLRRLARIDMSGLDARIRKTRIKAACDVLNPLTGRQGASLMFSPQKGADSAMARRLEAAMANVARVIKKDIGLDVNAVPGAGAAGGLGAGAAAFLGAELCPGVELVIQAVGLRSKLKGCDFVITGEGRLDGQTALGKAPVGVAQAAFELGIPALAIGGCLGPGVEELTRHGIAAYFASFLESPAAELTPRTAARRLRLCAEQAGRIIGVCFSRRITGHE